MSVEIYIPSHTDDWGEQQLERAIGTGQSEKAACRTVRCLSVAVLPFENLSGNPGEDYLADAVTDDVTTDLSRLPGIHHGAPCPPTAIPARPSTCARSAGSLGCATWSKAACTRWTTCCG